MSYKKKRNFKSETLSFLFFLSFLEIIIEKELANDRRYDSNDSLGITNCSSDSAILVLEEIDELSDFFQKLFFSGGEG